VNCMQNISSRSYTQCPPSLSSIRTFSRDQLRRNAALDTSSPLSRAHTLDFSSSTSTTQSTVVSAVSSPSLSGPLPRPSSPLATFSVARKQPLVRVALGEPGWRAPVVGFAPSGVEVSAPYSHGGAELAVSDSTEAFAQQPLAVQGDSQTVHVGEMPTENGSAGLPDTSSQVAPERIEINGAHGSVHPIAPIVRQESKTEPASATEDAGPANTS
jgi:hypothetical protein